MGCFIKCRPHLLVMVSVIALRVSFSGFVKVYKLRQKSRICYIVIIAPNTNEVITAAQY